MDDFRIFSKNQYTVAQNLWWRASDDDYKSMMVGISLNIKKIIKKNI